MEDCNIGTTTQKLLEAFVKIKRLNRIGTPIDDLKHSEIFVLFCIKKSNNSDLEGIKVSEISKRMRVSKPTTSQVINRLVDNGYVERCKDKEDKRSVRINLTSKGEEATVKAKDSFTHFFDGLVNHLGEEKSSILADLLNEIYVYLNDNDGNDYTYQK